MNKNLIILLASNLDPCGGGRETWISNFLNDENIISKYDSITVVGSLVVQSPNMIQFPDSVKVIMDKNHNKKYFPGFVYYSLFVKKTLKKLYNSKESFDIISCGSWGESIALYFSSFFRRNNITTICWLRSIMTKELARIYPAYILKPCQMFELYMLKQYKTVIANGSDTGKYYQQHGVKNNVIPNGIQTKEFLVNYAKGSKCQFIGRTSVEKGLLYLINAINVIDKEKSEPDLSFSIIGDGPNSDSIKELERNTNILTYKGALRPDEIKTELIKANISFHLTLSKAIGGGGVSHSLLEAMASGHRIVCWDNDIFNQVIGSEYFFKAEEGSVESLIEQIKLASKSTEDESLYSNNMASCSKHYDFSVHVEKYCNLLC